MSFVLEYDPFNFMIILLFIYVILVAFIFIIIYNNTHGTRKELQRALYGISANSGIGTPATTCSNCIPSPKPLIGSSS
jgi:hypothetical protein